MSKKTGILVAIIAVVIVLTVVIIGNKNKRPEYRTEPLSKTDITETVTASGTVNPVTSISVGTQVSGTVKDIFADFNSPVKKGQILAEIDPSLFQAQVDQSSANVYSAQANLQKIRSIMANDSKTYRRNLSLYKNDYIAKSDVDLAESVYYSDKAQIAQATAQIAQARADLRNKQTNLKYTKIKSPVDGVVISRNIDVGQTVAASFQTPTLFLVAQDLTKMQIYTSVAEADIGKIQVGQPVEYTLDGYPDSIFKGTVKQIRIAPTTVQNVVTYDVVISVDNKDMKLKPGMTANVSVITAQKKGIYAVSNEALRFTPDKSDDAPKYKEQGVWVLENKKPKRITIKTGLSDGENTEVLSNQLKEGQKIIISIKKKSKGDKQKGGGRPPMRMM